jgi:hypothetical protein
MSKKCNNHTDDDKLLSRLSTGDGKIDILDLGVGRSMDILMYVLYSGDQNFIQNMVCKVVAEVAEEQKCPELLLVLNHKNNQLLCKCLFFLMLDFHSKFRYWVLNVNDIGLQPICPYKVARFLKNLREEIAPKFLVNETQRLDDLERALKIEYIRS